MSLTNVTYSTVLVAHACPSCGIPHAIPQDVEKLMLERRGALGRHCYCPNGHRWHFTGQSDADRLKTELERSQQSTESARRDADHQRRMRQEEERRARAYKGVITRTKRRVAHGVCPCCSRTFQDLQRHMAGQHPDYVKTAVDAPTA